MSFEKHAPICEVGGVDGLCEGGADDDDSRLDNVAAQKALAVVWAMLAS
jgi:hypothetical protein